MRNAFGLLRSMLTMAAHDDLIPSNPCYTVELPERTGIRWGEAEALEVADVALDSQLLYVHKAVKWDTTKSVRGIGPTKTLRGDRTVTLPSSLVEVRPLVTNQPQAH